MRFPQLIDFLRGFPPEFSDNSFWRWILRPLLLSGLALWALTGCDQPQTVSVPEAATLPAPAPTVMAPPSSTPSPRIQTTPAPDFIPQATFSPEPPAPIASVAIEEPPAALTAPEIALELSPPADIPMEWSESIIVAGFASPGATVSVNGVPALPAADGRFSVALAAGYPENPVLFEIVASTPAGGLARTITAALPMGDGITAWIGTVEELSGDHPRAVSGETDISLMTGSGLVEMTSTAATVVHIPRQHIPGGDEPPIPSIEDVTVGDRAAVSAAGGRVLHLVVLPEGPVNSLHFSGVVVPSDAPSPGDAFLTLWDMQSNQISAALSPAVQERSPGTLVGTLVTAILARPNGGGELRITGLDPSGNSLDRVAAALELARDAGDTEAVAGLLRGLAVTATRSLTLLNEASHSSQAPLAGYAREEMTVLRDAYDQTLARYQNGPSLLEIEGIITSLSANPSQASAEYPGSQPVRGMIVESRSGALELSLGPQTAVWLTPGGTPPEALEGWLNGFAGVPAYSGEYGGSGISINQLDLGHRVIAAYDPATLEVARVAALASSRLEDRLARSLLPLAGKGEMVGTVTHLDLQGQARSVYVQDDATGGTVIFSATPESQTVMNGLPAPLGTDIAGMTVSVLFDPESGEIVELSTLDMAPGLDAVAGVVSSFVSKIIFGNVTIMTSSGELTTFTHDQDTVIRRDGRRISASDVRLGDLVRPNTLHHSATPARTGIGGPALTFLSLKSPGPTGISGTVRGLSGPPNGDMRVTLITDDLVLLTLAVTADTGITRLGIEIQINSLRIGDRITQAIYDPTTRELIQLDLAAAS